MAHWLLKLSAMKAILVSLVSLALAAGASSFAFADKPRASKPVKKPNFGDAFELKGRSSSGPRIVDTAVVRTVTEHQAGRVIKDKIADLENCWLRLPAGRRIASAATLHVTVEAAGTVTAARLDGELPAGVGKCITAAAGRWTFPATDGRTELEHGITLTSR